jgi:soluble lytic murein transglycosylase-like protein
MTTPFRPLIEKTAREHGLPADLVEAVVRTESSGNPRAYRAEAQFWVRYLKGKPFYEKYGPARAAASYGLMQLMFSTARELGFRGEPEDLYDPETNLRWGCTLLADLIGWADGMEDHALGAYNAGKGGYRSEAAGRYVTKVRRHVREIQAERAGA